MKVKPKIPETFDEFAYYHNCNPEEISDYRMQRIYPKDYKTKIKYAYKLYVYDAFFDDLYDDQIEYETRQSNLAKNSNI